MVTRGTARHTCKAHGDGTTKASACSACGSERVARSRARRTAQAEQTPGASFVVGGVYLGKRTHAVGTRRTPIIGVVHECAAHGMCVNVDITRGNAFERRTVDGVMTYVPVPLVARPIPTRHNDAYADGEGRCHDGAHADGAVVTAWRARDAFGGFATYDGEWVLTDTRAHTTARSCSTPNVPRWTQLPPVESARSLHARRLNAYARGITHGEAAAMWVPGYDARAARRNERAYIAEVFASARDNGRMPRGKNPYPHSDACRASRIDTDPDYRTPDGACVGCAVEANAYNRAHDTLALSDATHAAMRRMNEHTVRPTNAPYKGAQRAETTNDAIGRAARAMVNGTRIPHTPIGGRTRSHVLPSMVVPRTYTPNGTGAFRYA